MPIRSTASVVLSLCLINFGWSHAMAQENHSVQSDSQMVVSLWPKPLNAQPNAPESVTERGKGEDHDRLLRNIADSRLRVFLPQQPDPNRPACIVCPGGGYGFLTVDKEGDEVARMLNRNGIAAFVLVYRLPDGSAAKMGVTPPPIQDVHRAIRLIRASSEKWNLDPARIGIMGFSAGGHVASTAATQFDAGDSSDADPIARESSRPDFAVLMYPVISMHDPIAHVGSRNNLLGQHASIESMDRYSSDQNVTRQTPPLFILHAEDDKTVPVQNSLNMAEAASRAGVPCELVLLHSGGHGFGLGINGGEPTKWPGLCINWMRTSHILSTPLP